PMPTPADPNADRGLPWPPERLPVDWLEFWTRPKQERHFHLWPFLGRGEQVRLYSVAKVGESLLSLGGAVRLATGGHLLGRECTPATVVYLDQENTIEDWRCRLDDLGVNADHNLTRLVWYSLQSWPPLDIEAGGAALLDAVAQHHAEVVVLDTESKLLGG